MVMAISSIINQCLGHHCVSSAPTPNHLLLPGHTKQPCKVLFQILEILNEPMETFGALLMSQLWRGDPPAHFLPGSTIFSICLDVDSAKSLRRKKQFAYNIINANMHIALS